MSRNLRSPSDSTRLDGHCSPAVSSLVLFDTHNAALRQFCVLISGCGILIRGRGQKIRARFLTVPEFTVGNYAFVLHKMEHAGFVHTII